MDFGRAGAGRHGEKVDEGHLMEQVGGSSRLPTPRPLPLHPAPDPGPAAVVRRRRICGAGAREASRRPARDPAIAEGHDACAWMVAVCRSRRSCGHSSFRSSIRCVDGRAGSGGPGGGLAGERSPLLRGVARCVGHGMFRGAGGAWPRGLLVCACCRVLRWCGWQVRGSAVGRELAGGPVPAWCTSVGSHARVCTTCPAVHACVAVSAARTPADGAG